MYAEITKLAHEIPFHKPLSQREMLFVQHRLATKTATEAARLAGYESNPGSQASRLMRRTRVRDAVRQARDALAERTSIDHNRIVELLLQSYYEASDKGDSRNMLKAAVEIGNLCGLYPD